MSEARLGTKEDSREVDAPAKDVRRVMHHWKHRYRITKLSDSKQFVIELTALMQLIVLLLVTLLSRMMPLLIHINIQLITAVLWYMVLPLVTV